MHENTLQLNSINLRICQFRMNLQMNMLKCEACNWTECASTFSLCLALSSVTAQAVCQAVCFVCVCEIFMHRSGDVLWGCSSGERQPASFPLPPPISFSFPLLCRSSTHYLRLPTIVLRHCLPLSLSCTLFPHLAVSPPRCCTVEEQHHCALHPLFRRPSIFQDCLKIDCYISPSHCTGKHMQAKAHCLAPYHP